LFLLRTSMLVAICRSCCHW